MRVSMTMGTIGKVQMRVPLSVRIRFVSPYFDRDGVQCHLFQSFLDRKASVFVVVFVVHPAE